MLLYRFNTKSADDIDIQRISEENKAMEALLVIVGDSKEALLLLHNNFLKKFNSNDDLIVSRERLKHNWGNDAWSLTQYTAHSVSYYCDSTTTKITHHKGRVVRIDEISEVEKQLQAARNYKRCFEVKVHSL